MKRIKLLKGRFLHAASGRMYQAVDSQGNPKTYAVGDSVAEHLLEQESPTGFLFVEIESDEDEAPATGKKTSKKKAGKKKASKKAAAKAETEEEEDEAKAEGESEEDGEEEGEEI